MSRCQRCDRRADELSRTATRVWFGCPACHRSWNADIESSRTVDSEGTVGVDAIRPTEMSIVRGCIVAGVAVVVALGLRMILRPALGSASPFLLFTPAVAISAFYGGIVPGLLATGLSTMLGSHFFLSGVGEPLIEKWDRIFLFLLVGGVITASSSLLRRSRQQLSESLWRELKARAIAEAADRAKDDFLALVSHELQTPMSVVLGWIVGIRRRQLSPEALNHALDAVERNARILSRLVDDVLDRSRIANGMLRIDPQMISLAPVVRSAVDQLRGRIETSGLHLDVVVPPEDPLIVGDSIRLQQVFANLLANAIKFTPKGGDISVTMTVADTVARVVVWDTGCGIAPDFLPHVFEAFRQGRETPQRSVQGLGLGLSIARYLVERHEGTITVASDGPGRGSAFTVTLPLAQPRERHGRASGLPSLPPRTSPALIH